MGAMSNAVGQANGKGGNSAQGFTPMPPMSNVNQGMADAQAQMNKLQAATQSMGSQPRFGMPNQYASSVGAGMQRPWDNASVMPRQNAGKGAGKSGAGSAFAPIQQAMNRPAARPMTTASTQTATANPKTQDQLQIESRGLMDAADRGW